MTVPLAPLPPMATSAGETVGDPERPLRLRGCTILLVDDEEANLDLLEAVLGGAGYTHLVRTTDPRDVAGLVAAHAPDLVLLDLHMPHRHGLTVLADLRASTPPGEYRPVLVLTADVTGEAKEYALTLGARDFVTKPFDAAEVLLRVENLLDARLLHGDERRARERAEAAEARSALLAEWSRRLAASLDPAAVLAALPRLLVPGWASACAAGVRAGAADDAAAFATAAAEDDADAAAVLPALTRAAAAFAAGDATRAAFGASSVGAALGAAIVTGDGPVGAIVAVPAPAHGPGVLDQALVDELAARAGMAAEHARLLAAAQLATDERERLLAVVAHDLRNPLGAVAMYAEVAPGLQPDDAAGAGARYTRDALAAIHASTVTMQRLVEDLLDASSLRGGALRVHRTACSLAEPFIAAAAMLRPLADAAGVTLDVVPDDGAADRSGAVDGARLVQLLSNLVGNAIKFTPPGGAVTVRYSATDDALAASVADTGPGIAPDDLPHLFTAFWRGDRRGRRGVGLGLWIARAIVEAHDGELRVESRRGRRGGRPSGTTFHFTLPFAPVARRRED